MLPSDLLVVSKRKGAIWPRYAKLANDNLEVATSLIEAYKRHVGEKKSVLKEFVGELEDRGYEYRFVRGLSFLLDKRSIFKCLCQVNPVDVRRRAYQATGKFGLPTTQEQRERIIEIVASEIKVDGGAVERFLYADLDSELVLEKFDPLLPEELLEEYNLSLTQTLLFDSTELNFTASGNWQRIFYAVKRFGLIYEANRNGRFWVKIDGPASLFKLTRRYGTAIAKLLPVIMANPEWTVEAKILWKYTNEICDFKIESWKHRAILKKPQLSAVSYDSAVEEDFAAHFQALKSGWNLRREPEPVLAGKQVIIPDFSLEREGIKVYMEVVGFWTTEYLLRKIEKLKKVDVSMLVAVNEALACEKLASLRKHVQLNVIYYQDRIPLAPILRYLEEAFREVKATQKGLVKDLPIVFTEPVVTFEEFAARIGVSVEAVKTALTERPPQDYVVLPNSLVRKERLQEIEKRIDAHLSQTGRLQLTDALSIFEAEGVSDATSALENLGYRIRWRGISAEKAEVLKPQKSPTNSPVG
jgi:predicted nuclease of restriction endonuclease-like RecB superfamily